MRATTFVACLMMILFIINTTVNGLKFAGPATSFNECLSRKQLECRLYSKKPHVCINQAPKVCREQFPKKNNDGEVESDLTSRQLCFNQQEALCQKSLNQKNAMSASCSKAYRERICSSG
jgi:hypothetical protein